MTTMINNNHCFILLGPRGNLTCTCKFIGDMYDTRLCTLTLPHLLMPQLQRETSLICDHSTKKRLLLCKKDVVYVVSLMGTTQTHRHKTFTSPQNVDHEFSPNSSHSTLPTSTSPYDRPTCKCTLPLSFNPTMSNKYF